MTLKATSAAKQQLKDKISLSVIWLSAGITVGFLLWGCLVHPEQWPVTRRLDIYFQQLHHHWPGVRYLANDCINPVHGCRLHRRGGTTGHHDGHLPD